MVYVALAEAAALVVCVVVFAGLIRSMQRSHARREDLLLNQMLNMAGKPWQPAPAAVDLDEHRQRIEEAREARRAWTTNPEQGIAP